MSLIVAGQTTKLATFVSDNYTSGDTGGETRGGETQGYSQNFLYIKDILVRA